MSQDLASLMVPTSSLKMLRETLCEAQAGLTYRPGNNATYERHRGRLQLLINQIDGHRPLGPDGKHKDLHTPTCGCEDKPVCVHCGAPVMPTSGGDWIHENHLFRCQSKDVPYGHLAHPPGVPCRADGPNPCLGAFPVATAVSQSERRNNPTWDGERG